MKKETTDHTGLFKHFSSQSPMIDASAIVNKASEGKKKDEFDFKETGDEKYESFSTSNPYIPWGDDNQFPYQLDDAAKKSSVLEIGMQILSALIWAQGIWYYKEVDIDGKISKVKVKNADIDKWLRRNSIHKIYEALIYDRVFYGLAWPAINVKKINGKLSCPGIRWYDAPHGRFQRKNIKSNKIENVYINPNWRDGAVDLATKEIPSELRNWVFMFPLLEQILGDAIDQIETDEIDEKGKTFIYCIKGYTSGKAYYPREPWHSTYHNGWLKLSSGIPDILVKLFLYSITLNYLITFDEDFIKKFREKVKAEHKGNKQPSDSEIDAMIKAEIDKYLAGQENMYTTYFGTHKYTNNTDKPRMSVLIDVIDNKLKEGNLIIPNIQQADGQIISTLGLTSSMVEKVEPGVKGNGGSGSNIREAQQSFISRIHLIRQNLLEPLRIVHEINGWPDDIQWGFKDMIIETLDNNPTGNKTIATG